MEHAPAMDRNLPVPANDDDDDDDDTESHGSRRHCNEQTVTLEVTAYF